MNCVTLYVPILVYREAVAALRARLKTLNNTNKIWRLVE